MLNLLYFFFNFKKFLTLNSSFISSSTIINFYHYYFIHFILFYIVILNSFNSSFIFSALLVVSSTQSPSLTFCSLQEFVQLQSSSSIIISSFMFIHHFNNQINLKFQSFAQSSSSIFCSNFYLNLHLNLLCQSSTIFNSNLIVHFNFLPCVNISQLQLISNCSFKQFKNSFVAALILLCVYIQHQLNVCFTQPPSFQIFFFHIHIQIQIQSRFHFHLI